MSTLRQTIISREQTAISFDEIMKALDGHNIKPNFVFLDDLPENPTDGNIFKGKECVCILGTIHSHSHATKFNHWVCIIKKPREYWFFDSLGHTIKELTIKLASVKQSLVNWSQNKRIRENTQKIQKTDIDVNTCGMHVVIRLLRKDLNNVQYVKWLKHGFLNPDITVSLLCYIDLLKK